MSYQALPKELRIQDSSIAGQGIFAKEDIPDNTFLGMSHLLLGEVIYRTPLGGFINHADKPNSKIKSIGDVTRCLVTKEDIAKGTEITVFYTLY